MRCPVCDGQPILPGDFHRDENGHAAWCPKRLYPRGTRVRLLGTNDPWTKLEPGILGTVSLVDDVGTVHVDWDTGSHLGLSDQYGDRFEVVT